MTDRIRQCSLFRVLLIALLVLVLPMRALALTLDDHPKLKAIADELIAEGQYTEPELRSIFGQAEIKQSVIDAMTSPAEYKFTWGKYRKLFMQEDRIQQGADFWEQYESDLTRAEQEYGVPAEVIVAIIGVESKYGKFRGKYKVLDSLSSLVVGYPRRSKFFGQELKHFLILCKENGLNPVEILGSYAGAVGYPQFISSSYRKLAIDFSGDNKADLINEPVDAIGSIANYFIENGWKPGEPVSSEGIPQVPAAVEALANRKRKVQYSVADLKSKGATLPSGLGATDKLGVLMLDANENPTQSKRADVYIVRSGDTACQIAERHNVSCRSLFALNKLNKDGKIFRGQRLKLPAKAIKKQVAKSPTQGKWQISSKANQDQSVAVENEPPVDESQPVYFYTHPNFYAITKYNHSVLYAMAVHQLSQAIAEAKSNR